MRRPQLKRCKTHPYHVTCRTNNKDFFPIPLSEVWKIMLEELHRLHLKHFLAVHAFVLMGNHFHLLCITPEGNLDEIMKLFLKNTSLRISNHLWEGSYKWSLVDSQTHYYQVYRYIFQNPVRAGIFDKVESYPYTTLRDVPIPLHSFIPMSFGGSEGELHWLNEHFQKEDQELIRLGLRKSQFDIGQRILPRKSSLV